MLCNCFIRISILWWLTRLTVVHVAVYSDCCGKLNTYSRHCGDHPIHTVTTVVLIQYIRYTVVSVQYIRCTVVSIQNIRYTVLSIQYIQLPLWCTSNTYSYHCGIHPIHTVTIVVSIQYIESPPWCPSNS